MCACTTPCTTCTCTCTCARAPSPETPPGSELTRAVMKQQVQRGRPALASCAHPRARPSGRARRPPGPRDGPRTQSLDQPHCHVSRPLVRDDEVDEALRGRAPPVARRAAGSRRRLCQARWVFTTRQKKEQQQAVRFEATKYAALAKARHSCSRRSFSSDQARHGDGVDGCRTARGGRPRL